MPPRAAKPAARRPHAGAFFSALLLPRGLGAATRSGGLKHCPTPEKQQVNPKSGVPLLIIPSSFLSLTHNTIGRQPPYFASQGQTAFLKGGGRELPYSHRPRSRASVREEEGLGGRREGPPRTPAPGLRSTVTASLPGGATAL